jgi:glycosyltransferase involved in cell wall biosynthesis
MTKNILLGIVAIIFIFLGMGPSRETEVSRPGKFPFDEALHEVCKEYELLSFQLKEYVPLVQQPMVVVIPSYKNADWYERNLASVYGQNYQNYSVIYVDDASPDGTGDLVQSYIKKMHQEDRTTLIKNSKNQGAMANLYHAIHSCSPDSIIVTLDGDDWFAKDSVLELINKIYNKYDVLLTYGSYQHYPYQGIAGAHCRQVPHHIFVNRAYRTMHLFMLSHQRTFKAHLFQAIAQEDLMYEGVFFDTLSDVAMMYPMAEMAGSRIMHVPDMLYVYNLATPLNDHKLRRKRQTLCSKVIKQRPVYAVLSA